VTSGQQPLRNAIHLATAVAAPWVLLVPRPWNLAGIAAVLAVVAACDLGRLHRGFRARLDAWLPGVFRPTEIPGVSGGTLLRVGDLAVAWWFSPTAAAGGIVALAVGDPAAAVVGRWYGARHGLQGRKTWLGSLACFAAALPALWLLPGLGLDAAAAGAAMAALVERRAGRLDNLLLPLAVAMLLGLWAPRLG
jgi:dolichol kinase